MRPATIAVVRPMPSVALVVPAAQRRTPMPAPTAPPTTTPEPPTPTVDIATLRYIFPVQSTRRISYGRYHHDYPATDIFAPVGSQFLAPTSGVVDFVQAVDLWNPRTNVPADRSGMAIAIIGDDGVRYYGSHLSAIAPGITVGVRVEAGWVLGLTGKSGNARSTPAHLHFGISRPTTPDDWQTRRGQINPYTYLRCWQRSPEGAGCPRPADEVFGR